MRPRSGPDGKWRRVEFRIAVIPKRDTSEIICSGFGRGVDHAARGVSVFRRIRRGLHRELLHRLGREADHGSRNTDAGVVDAVGQNGCTAGTTTVQAQVKTGNWLI